MRNWRDSVCKAATPARVSDYRVFVGNQPSGSLAPIDAHYDRHNELIAIARPERLDADPIAGGLAIVGFVANVEEYVREMIGRILNLCPIARRNCSSKKVNLSTVLWHRDHKSMIGRTVVEHTSLAGSSDIKTALGYIGFTISSAHQVSGVLDEFDRICQLRHAFVHSGRIMPGKNADGLGIGSERIGLNLAATFSGIQEVAAVCQATTVALNNDLFELLCRRWAIDWRLEPDWSEDDSERRFNSIWLACHSKRDKDAKLVPDSMRPKTAMKLILEEFNLV